MGSPTLDGQVNAIASGVTSKVLALTTTQTNDVIVAVIGYELGAAQRDVTGVSGATLGAFTRRAKISNAGQNHETVEIWWKASAGILAAENITVTWDAAFDDTAIVIFGVHGCNNIAAPWDTNGTLPASSTSGASPTATYSSDAADIMVLGLSGVVDNLGSYVPPTGWTNIATPHNNGGAIAQSTPCDYRLFSAAQSSATYKPGHNDQGVVIADVLVGTAVPAPGRITQGVREAIAVGDSDARITQAHRLTLSHVAPPGRIDQAHRLAITAITPPARITQAVRLSIARAIDCVTHWCQCWTITRRDGVVFRFTSLDSDFTLGAFVYLSCGSLQPSASEESSQVGSVSNMELTGILAHDSITEEELYGGKFDDAFVEVWLHPFEGTDAPRRIAAGWIGQVQHGEQGWTGEVIGPGAKIDQQALVVPYAPACRWVFGDSRCTKDLTALQTTGQVTGVDNRGLFTSDAPEPGNGSQWENGRVIWTSGRNAGVVCEVKTADFAADTEINLWALCPFLPELGDTFTLQPGCDLSESTCKSVYGNLINFGGFAEVPGNDALAATPIAKIDE